MLWVSAAHMQDLDGSAWPSPGLALGRELGERSHLLFFCSLALFRYAALQDYWVWELDFSCRCPPVASPSEFREGFLALLFCEVAIRVHLILLENGPFFRSSAS